MIIPYETSATTATNASMTDDEIKEKSSSGFSYLIRPVTPSVFGTETYDGEKSGNNDDEFFLTAGGIIHSCPNIYELSTENPCEHRRLQSCEHLLFLTQPSTSIQNQLNTYDIEFSRYSILPRFQPISTLASNDSINSEIELYKERHARGLWRKYVHSSFLPTTWKSENYLLFIPVLDHDKTASLTSMDSNKLLRSIGQTVSSILA